MNISFQEILMCKSKAYNVHQFFTTWSNYVGLFGPNKNVRTYTESGKLMMEIDSVFLGKKNTEKFMVICADGTKGWSIKIHKVFVDGGYGSWDAIEIDPIDESNTKITYTFGLRTKNRWMSFFAWMIIPIAKIYTKKGIERAINKIESI